MILLDGHWLAPIQLVHTAPLAYSPTHPITHPLNHPPNTATRAAASAGVSKCPHGHQWGDGERWGDGEQRGSTALCHRLRHRRCRGAVRRCRGAVRRYRGAFIGIKRHRAASDGMGGQMVRVNMGKEQEEGSSIWPTQIHVLILGPCRQSTRASMDQRCRRAEGPTRQPPHAAPRFNAPQAGHPNHCSARARAAR